MRWEQTTCVTNFKDRIDQWLHMSCKAQHVLRHCVAVQGTESCPGRAPRRPDRMLATAQRWKLPLQHRSFSRTHGKTLDSDAFASRSSFEDKRP